MSFIQWLIAFLRHLRRFFEADKLIISVIAGHSYHRLEGGKMSEQIQEGGSFRVRVRAETAANNPATIDGSPQITSSDTGVLTVTPDPTDPFVATVTGAKAGSARVDASGDGDLGPGVRVVTGSLDVTVTPAEADHLVVEVVP